MTIIGWEFWGLKFSWFITALVTVIIGVYTVLTTRGSGISKRIDTTAGDEGEEW